MADNVVMLIALAFGVVAVIFCLAKFTNAFNFSLKIGSAELGAQANNNIKTVQREHGNVNVGGNLTSSKIAASVGDGTATRAGNVDVGGNVTSSDVKVDTEKDV